MKKTKILLSILLIILLLVNTNVFAASNILKVVEQSSETKYLENDQGYISKSIVDADEKNGEVTIELKLANTSKKQTSTTQAISQGNSEIMLVIDDSGSMYTNISEGITRKDAVFEASKELVNKLFNNYSNIKVGVVKFSTASKIEDEGTIKDAQKMCGLTNDVNTILSAIEEETDLSGATDLEAGIELAKGEYSNTANKIMVILTDGEPNEAINNVGGKSVDDASKEALINAGNSGINIITMLTEIENEYTAEYIFGTKDNPTIGKYYYIKDADINNIITDSIYTNVSQLIHTPNENITNTKIVDYFPQDIMDNFEFSYVGNASMGTISDKIDETTKTITWDIGTVKDLEEATVKYKLKLKDMDNKDLFDKVIATNEKVVLTYKDINSKDYTVVLDSSPKIKLTEEIKEDETTATTILPKTGLKNILITIIGIVLVAGAIFYIKYFKFKNI